MLTVWGGSNRRRKERDEEQTIRWRVLGEVKYKGDWGTEFNSGACTQGVGEGHRYLGIAELVGCW